MELTERQIMNDTQAGTFLHVEKVGYGDVFIDEEHWDISGLLQAQRDQTVKDMLRWFVEWGESNGDKEICDPDTMPYFIDYRWVTLESWQELKNKLAELEGK